MSVSSDDRETNVRLFKQRLPGRSPNRAKRTHIQDLELKKMQRQAVKDQKLKELESTRSSYNILYAKLLSQPRSA